MSEAVAISPLTMSAKLVSIATVMIASRYTHTQTHREVVKTKQPPQTSVAELCGGYMLEFRNCSYLHIVGPICAAAFQILAAEGSDRQGS